MKAKYIVFDGMDGSGKGTQLKLLEGRFGSSAAFTREPGGTPFAEEIRKLVRDNPLAGKSTPLNNFLLFWAAREELQQNFVTPTLQSGKHVFSDRGDSSTFAFQLYGEKHWELIETFLLMRSLVFPSDGRKRRAPDMYILFDLPAEVARKRAMQDAGRTQNHFDTRDIAYYKRVRNGFREFGKHYPTQIVNATKTPEEVHRSVMKILAEMGITE